MALNPSPTTSGTSFILDQFLDSVTGNKVQKAGLCSSTGAIINPAIFQPVTPVRSSSLESSHLFKSGAGSLVDASCFATADGFYMLFDATSAPADGAVAPLTTPIPVQAGQSVSYVFPASFPLSFATGLTGVFSTTGPFTKTAAASAFLAARVF